MILHKYLNLAENQYRFLSSTICIFKTTFLNQNIESSKLSYLIKYDTNILYYLFYDFKIKVILFYILFFIKIFTAPN